MVPQAQPFSIFCWYLHSKMFCPFLHVLFLVLSRSLKRILDLEAQHIAISWPFNAIGCKHDQIQDSEKVSESGILNPCLDMIRFGDFLSVLWILNLESRGFAISCKVDRILDFGFDISILSMGYDMNGTIMVIFLMHGWFGDTHPALRWVPIPTLLGYHGYEMNCPWWARILPRNDSR